LRPQSLPHGQTAYERMGRRWLGLGNLDAPCWFVGLEPGGSERPDWPEVWEERYSSAEVVDPRDLSDPDYGKLFGPGALPQRTWEALIRIRLSYAGGPADDVACLRYQRERFASGSVLGLREGEALLELSAYAAKNLAVEVPRDQFVLERVKRMRELLAEYRPETLVCYGLSRRWYFQELCGGLFDANGFRWSGTTLCALTLHPTPRHQAAHPPEYWLALGAEMRRRVQAARET